MQLTTDGGEGGDPNGQLSEPKHENIVSFNSTRINILKLTLFGLSPNYRTKCHFLTLILIIIHRTDDFLGSKLFLYYYCIIIPHHFEKVVGTCRLPTTFEKVVDMYRVQWWVQGNFRFDAPPPFLDSDNFWFAPPPPPSPPVVSPVPNRYLRLWTLKMWDLSPIGKVVPTIFKTVAPPLPLPYRPSDF
jgi:hypothetical protein